MARSIKLLALFQFCRVLHGTGKIMRLDKSQISLAVFSGFSLHLRFLAPATAWPGALSAIFCARSV